MIRINFVKSDLLVEHDEGLVDFLKALPTGPVSKRDTYILITFYGVDWPDNDLYCGYSIEEGKVKCSA